MNLQPHSSNALFTACSVNYLPKAMALLNSYVEQGGTEDFYVLVADRKRVLDIKNDRMRIIWAEDIGYPNYLQAAFKYNVIEFNTALKPFFADRLLEKYEKILYLDPDVCVFSSLQPLFDALDDHDVILTPHSLTPYRGDGRPSDTDLLRFGAYNLGFFGVRSDGQGRAVMQWWHECCAEHCFYEPTCGLGVDQKWMDLAPAYFSGVHVIRHPGANVAFWNLHERTLSRDDQANWLVNGEEPLLFVHFSSYDAQDPDAIAAKQTRLLSGSRPDFRLARDVYARYLAEAEAMIDAPDSDYAYAIMSDGRGISDLARRVYVNYFGSKFPGDEDPFSASSAIYKFAAKHRLLLQEGRTGHRNFKEADKFSSQKKIITKGYRALLSLLGADRYFALMRYISFYSPTLNQKDLFD